MPSAVAVLGKFKLHDDRGQAFGGDGADFVNLTDGVDGVFHLAGDFGFNFLGRGSGVDD